VQVLKKLNLEKGELAISVAGEKKVKTKIMTMLGMANYSTDCFYLWCVG